MLTECGEEATYICNTLKAFHTSVPCDTMQYGVSGHTKLAHSIFYSEHMYVTCMVAPNNMAPPLYSVEIWKTTYRQAVAHIQ